MGLAPDDALASIRLSLGFASVDADVTRALAVIPDAVERLRAAAPAGAR
jgi:cysteine sulfinate desulfinase/cysteine desulfurase-like protein